MKFFHIFRLSFFVYVFSISLRIVRRLNKNNKKKHMFNRTKDVIQGCWKLYKRTMTNSGLWFFITFYFAIYAHQLLLFWLKLIEYEPVAGSCCIWKLLVDRPNGRRIILPKSFSLSIISAFIFSLRSSMRGGSLTEAARASALSGSSSRTRLKSAKLSSSLSLSS